MKAPHSTKLRLAMKFVAIPPLMIGAGIFMAATGLQAMSPLTQSDSEKRQEAGARYGALPLSFERNVGQFPSTYDSVARGAGYAVYVSNHEMLIALRPTQQDESEPARGGQNTLRKQRRGEEPHDPGTLLRFTLKGSNLQAESKFTAPLPGQVNYMRGDNPKAWHRDIPIFAKLGYQSVYPGIDIVYHGNQRQLEHDFIVAPGSDPKVVEWMLSGQEKIEVDSDGSLLLRTGAGMVRMPKAIAFQDMPEGRRSVAVEYELRGAENVGFKLGEYDTRFPLVIDPVLYYSTFLGGNDYDEAYGIAVDSAGNAYVTGVTYSTDFPLAAARQAINGTLGDAFVAKINPAGSALVYCTYLGGNGYDEGASIAVDSSGAAYVAGVTFSTNFPVASPQQPNNAGGGDAFMAKLDPTGATLAFSTYLGAAGYDAANAVAVSASGIACLAGTYEDPSGNDSSGVVAKYNAAGTELTYYLKIGGSGADSVYGLAIDTTGNVYLAGETESRDFPTSSESFDTGYNGAGDAFVSKLNPAGTAFVYSTFLGGRMADKALAIAIDSSGNAYVTGETYSNDFPLMNPYQPAISTGGDAFVTKLNTAGAALTYSSYLGGGNLDFGTGITVDSTKSAHVTGYTASANFPLLRALQSTNAGGGDVFVTRFLSAGKNLGYSTFLGGKKTDYANAIAVDSSQVSYIAGYTVSSAFPRYLPLQNTYGGVADAFVTKIGNPVVTITASDPNASEPGSNTGQFTVSRTGNPVKSLDVTIKIAGTAAKGTDYVSIPTTVTIPAGSVSKTITIEPLDDLIWEGDETVSVTIATNVNYTVGNPKDAIVTITDNEIKPTLTIEALDASASEPGTNTGKFRVTRNTSTAGTLTVKFSVTGTATSATDYTAVGTSVTFAAGSSTADITVKPIDDTIYEGSETVIATLAANGLYSIGTPSSATVTIADDEVPPVVTITPLDGNASEPGTNTGSFRFTRTGSTAQTLTVNFGASGTATNGQDMNTVGTSVVFATGSTTADLVVTPKDDLIYEGDETVVITLLPGTGYSVGAPNNATIIIKDNEPDPNPTVTVQATDSSAAELGEKTGAFTFTRTGSTATAISVSYAVSGTATSFSDFSGVGGSVIIPAGSASAAVTLTPTDDLLIEGSETVTVTLASSAAYTIGTPNTATVTIADDDTVKPTVTVAATDSAASETGLNPGTFTFTRSGGSFTVPLTVSFAITGTATAFSDYSGIAGSVTIPVGSATATATLTPVDDLLIEGNETVIATISADAIYTIGTPKTATINLADNDGTKPTVTVVATDATASEPGANTGTFTFSRSGGDTSVALSVGFSVSGTATQFSDFSGVNSSVTIPSGSLSATVTLTVSDDLLIEGDETAIVTLNTDTLYNVGAPGSATVTITDNDSVKPAVTLVATDASASEAGTNPATLTFTRTGGDNSVGLSVSYAIGGTATQYSDYGGIFSSVFIPAGNSSVTVTLQVYDDLIIEGTETVTATLSPDPNGLYVIGGANSATLTIADDDTVKPVVSLAASDASASEAGTNNGTFTFTRTGGSLNVALTVSYEITGTATRFSDYSGIFGTVTIPAGSSTLTVTIQPYDDLIIEPSETVIVTLITDPENLYTVGTPKAATITIADDDTVKPTVSVVAADPNAAEPGATVNPGSFTFTRTGGSTNVSLTITFATTGSASAFSDYTGVYSSVTIPAGSTATTLTVDPYADTLTEGNETVIVTISSDPSALYQIGSPATATVTISD